LLVEFSELKQTHLHFEINRNRNTQISHLIWCLVFICLKHLKI